MLRRSRLPFLTLVLALVSAAVVTSQSPRTTIEQKITTRYVSPSELAFRFNVLGGLGGGERAVVTADDKARSVTFRINAGNESPLARRQMQLIVEDAMERFDVKQPEILLDLYVVQTSLLDDEQYRNLDTNFRAGTLALPPGQLTRGVIYRKTMPLRNLNLVKFDEAMQELRGQTQNTPVRGSGEVVSRIKADGNVYLGMDMVLQSAERAFYGETKELKLQREAVLNGRNPVVFVQGEKRPLEGNDPYPGRHDVMIYAYATIEREPGAVQRALEQVTATFE